MPVTRERRVPVDEAFGRWLGELSSQVAELQSRLGEVQSALDTQARGLDELDSKVTRGFAEMRAAVDQRISIAVFGKMWRVALGLVTLIGGVYGLLNIVDKLHQMRLIG